MSRIDEIERMEERFIAFVQETFAKQRKWFLIDSGEGREMPSPPKDMYVEDLSGWLLPIERRGATKEDMTDDDEYGFVEWDEGADGELIVKWKTYPAYPA